MELSDHFNRALGLKPREKGSCEHRNLTAYNTNYPMQILQLQKQSHSVMHIEKSDYIK